MSTTTTSTKVRSLDEMRPTGSKAVKLAFSMLIASTLAVTLRFLARRRSSAHVGLDDIYMVAALSCFAAYSGILIRGRRAEASVGVSGHQLEVSYI